MSERLKFDARARRSHALLHTLKRPTFLLGFIDHHDSGMQQSPRRFNEESRPQIRSQSVEEIYGGIHFLSFVLSANLNWFTVPENFLEIEVRADSIYVILVIAD